MSSISSTKALIVIYFVLMSGSFLFFSRPFQNFWDENFNADNKAAEEKLPVREIRKHVVNSTVRDCQNEAVKVGVAKWVADTNGCPKFVWITNNVVNY